MTTAPEVLAWLKRSATKKVREGLSRYGIPDDRAVGVSVGELRKYAKTLGCDHELAAALWATGVYEARMLATFVDDPTQVTSKQMDQWCRDFDSWAICDTACFSLFDRTEPKWRKVDAWSKRRGEFQKRAAFALLASIAQHDKVATDEPFAVRLPLVEAAAPDGRNFVKKGVSWALRGVGERSRRLHRQALAIADQLAVADEPGSRWVGRDAARQLRKPAVLARLDKRG